MRTVVIGATGHIGTYLIPRLVALGHEVIAVSRGKTEPYHHKAAWNFVESVNLDRENEEQRGTFGEKIAVLEPDIVIDLICFQKESARHLAEALRGKIQHFLHCGTLWVHGPAEVVPTVESAPKEPFGDYGIHKLEIEKYLLEQARRNGFPATVLHPGHISGEGWVPINPAGNLDKRVYENLAAGKKVILPNQGLARLQHVHADDVAKAFKKAITHRSVSFGEAFHVTAPTAVTLRGYAKAVASWFGRKANLEFLPWDDWKADQPEKNVRLTYDHITHSPCASIDKARRLINYQPRYSTFQMVRESLEWLASQNKLNVAF